MTFHASLLRSASVAMLGLFLMATASLANDQKISRAITVFDSSGKPAQSGPAAPNAQIVGVTVGPGRAFNPNMVNIATGDTVQWTFAGPGHTVTSGPPCTIDSVYCSPSNTNCAIAGTSDDGGTFSHTFTQAGTYNYFCRIHCGGGMTGTVVVSDRFVSVTSTSRGATGEFIISGQSLPNVTVTIEAAPNLVSMFGPIGTATTNALGVYQFTDATANSLPRRFYRALY